MRWGSQRMPRRMPRRQLRLPYLPDTGHGTSLTLGMLLVSSPHPSTKGSFRLYGLGWGLGRRSNPTHQGQFLACRLHKMEKAAAPMQTHRHHHTPVRWPRGSSGSMKQKRVTKAATAYINTYTAMLEFITCLLPGMEPQACESLPSGAAHPQKE